MNQTTGFSNRIDQSRNTILNGKKTLNKSANFSPQRKRISSLPSERNETDRDFTKSKIYLRMLLRLGERFGTDHKIAPIVKEVLNKHLLSRP